MAASNRREIDNIFYDSEHRRLRIINKTELDKLEVLLKDGLDPNYELSDDCRCYEGYCLLLIAIELGNLKFVRLLFHHGVDVNLPFLRGGIKRIKDFHLYSSKEVLKHAVESNETSLQIAIRKLNTTIDAPETLIRICEAIEEKFILPSEHKIDPDEPASTYRKLQKIIFDGLIVAKKQGKPLLLLFGENHRSIVSLFIEALAIFIGKEYGINLLLCELNKKMLHDLENKEFPSFPWKTCFSALPLAKQYGYTLKAIDLGRDKALKNGSRYDEYEEKHSWDGPIYNDTPELMDYRDSVMHSVINNDINQHAIGILGSNHLQGLHRREFKNHHVVFIKTYDLIPADTLSETDAFYLSDQVIKLNQKSLEGMETFWYPAKAIKQAEKLHTENKIVLYDKFFVPKQGFFKCCKKSLPKTQQPSKSGFIHELKEGYNLIVKDIGFFPLAASLCREMVTRVSLRLRR